MAKLNATQQPSAAALMEGGPVDPHQDFLASVDMTQLHRCVHLHECLGKLPVFQVSLDCHKTVRYESHLIMLAVFDRGHEEYQVPIQ